MSAPEDVADERLFSLPLRAPEAWLVEPDVASHPEVADVHALAGLSW
jgi:hypothetical protein